jgi:hypothetical protein
MLGEGAALASVRLVGEGSASHCGGGKKFKSAALAFVRMARVGSANHCVGEHM